VKASPTIVFFCWWTVVNISINQHENWWKIDFIGELPKIAEKAWVWVLANAEKNEKTGDD